LLYRLIKNDQVDLESDTYQIPLVQIESNTSKVDDKGSDLVDRPTNDEARVQANRLIEEASAGSKSILDQAQSQAEKLLEDAKKAGYEQGFEKGYQEGYKAGKDKAEKDYEALLSSAKDLIEKAHIESRNYIKRTEDEIVDLAVSIAESIIKYSIDTRDEGIIDMVKAALHRAEEMGMILFRCSPDTILLLKANEHEFKKICPKAVFSFIEDKSIKSNGCIIETEEQVLDLEIQGQLEKVKTALKEMSEANNAL